MHICYALEPCQADTPIALTIGFFDGVHLGHKALIARCKELAPLCACVTFANHPSTIFSPKEPQRLITTTEQRVRLLEEAGVDLLYLLPFTKEFSQHSAQVFLLELRHQIPFTHLVLGHDARIGRGREGSPQQLKKIADSEGFTLEYIDAFQLNGELVSSSACRNAIKQGNLAHAEALLGRKLSYVGGGR